MDDLIRLLEKDLKQPEEMITGESKLIKMNPGLIVFF